MFPNESLYLIKMEMLSRWTASFIRLTDEPLLCALQTTFDTFNGTCSAFGGASGIGGSGGSLSKVAVAGIVISAIAVAALLVTCAWCCCCQLRS